MYLGFILSLNIVSCYCYVAYEMFHGFDVSTANSTPSDTTLGRIPVDLEGMLRTTVVSLTPSPATPSGPTSSQEPTPVPPVTSSKFQCPEEEQPSNIGAYEVPTQRDIVLLVRETLKREFNAYHEKALYFLKDIKEVTKATAAIKKKCFGTDRSLYKKCVRQVSNKCEIITKGLVSSLESQRLGVEAFTNGTVCNVKGMTADPIELIKTLAMEVASLEFALPGFLRLLNACSVYCTKIKPQQILMKPLRHMTDQDLVVKHFLTKKSYIQLLKGS